MRTGRYIRTIITMLTLLLYGAGEVWAQEPTLSASDIIIQVMPSGEEGKGSVTDATYGRVSASVSGRDVTLTVTPGSGYQTNADLIIAEKMVNPDRLSARRRAPGTGTFTVTEESGNEYSFTIPAEYDGAYVTVTFVPTTSTATQITRLSQISSSGNYILVRDIDASGHTSIASFSGTLEAAINPTTHMPYKIYNLSNPLFTTLTGTVKNLVLEDVSISSGDNDGNTGAIACTANGAARIYNVGILSGSVGGTGDTGGLVGAISGTARVINCYSFADITSGDNVGGIVGNNKETTNSDADNLKTMVMNCMFYGDLTGGTTKSPIYGGTIISNADNKGVGNYNYFRLEAPFVQPTGITYNCALGAEDRFLKRFEFYRLLLNSHRELAGWWATGTYSSSEMLKWVLETADRTIDNPKPYPVLKVQGRYPSIANYDAEHAPTLALVNGKPREEDRNKGGKFGTLTVNIQMGDGAVYQHPSEATITTSQLTLNITDKDPDRFNFNYYKVQLPYYNDVGTKNYNGNRVVTGWKIVNIEGGTPGTFTPSDTWGGYNFADRNCTNKDLYGTGGSNRIFNQGAYWDVPEGVTEITIEPYWAKCVYLADPNADKVYKSDMSEGYNVSNVGGGEIYTNGSSYSIAREDQVVYTSIGNAIASSGSALFSGYTDAERNNQSVYDYAVVLVGNYHHYYTTNKIEASKSKPYTVTSIDLDGDNEPDYSYILRFDGRCETHPVRADFINIPGLGMAQKSNGGTGSYNFGILIPKGWYESTNTSLLRFTQFEYEHSSRSETDAIIVQGGVMEQWVSYNQKGRSNKIPYIHVGGNVWFKEFHTGCHQDKNQTSGGNRFQPTKHSPISVTGGDFDEFYLTGLYVANADLDNYADNAECYINGGHFGTVCGAAMEGIGKANGADNTGDITWLIQNADIREFYAGGLNAAKPVTGNLSTTIVDSHVDIFCGGPKFGDMSANKTVTTNATGCTFGTFFGAGYGGNSYSRYAPSNQNNVTNINWNNWVKGQYTRSYNATYGGVSTRFVYQFLPMSDNKTNVARILVDFVKFSLATTRNVTSTLTGCTITNNFYGGGSLGKVDGDVTSTLTNCTVNGSVFGSGYSASLPTVEVDSIGFRVEPYYYDGLGTYRTGVKGVTTTYRWEHRNSISVDNTDHILYTTEDLTTLGTVTGKTTLNITGNTIVEGKVFNEDGTVKEITGGVFGGGDASAALGDTEVNINGGTSSSILNVFGGGNRADVSGNVTVNMQNGNVNQSVYGGGNLADVGGSVTVDMAGGTVNHDVYGGGNLADVGGSVTVDMAGGTVNHDVYGGGALANTNTANWDATKYEEVTVATGTSVTGLYTRSGDSEPYTYSEASGTASEGTAYYKKGTWADGKYNVSTGTTNKTLINLTGATIEGNVYGGGLGVLPSGSDPGVEALVYGDVMVKLNDPTASSDNCVVKGRIFGCNNLNGTPKNDVTVHIYKTQGWTNHNVEAGKSDDTIEKGTGVYEVAAVYGGGNQAAYVPVFDDRKTNVIIDGCDRTSIEYVYGGGNAASVPATKVTVNGCYEIGNVFGGGNGKEALPNGDPNPGAHVGFLADGTTTYGSGESLVELNGGTIHYTFGGSDTKGNVRVSAIVKLDDSGSCPLVVDEVYGAGNKAEQNGTSEIQLGCVSYLKELYGGSREADINNDVVLTIQSGSFDRVFGGNNVGGTISGTITVNVEETGCHLITIGQLYGGGNQAAYTGPWIDSSDQSKGRQGPTINVRSFSSIGEIYGGGYGETAVVTGNTSVNVNVCDGNDFESDPDPDKLTDEITFANSFASEERVITFTEFRRTIEGGFALDGGGNRIEDTKSVAFYMPTFISGQIGKIHSIYGGGNAAKVVGNTNVNIGTRSVINYVSGNDHTDKTVKGADIIGNVFGGGNQAAVTGNTNVVIGR